MEVIKSIRFRFHSKLHNPVLRAKIIERDAKGTKSELFQHGISTLFDRKHSVNWLESFVNAMSITPLLHSRTTGTRSSGVMAKRSQRVASSASSKL